MAITQQPRTDFDPGVAEYEEHIDERRESVVLLAPLTKSCTAGACHPAVGVKMSGYPTKIRSTDWTADSRYLVASGADTVTSWNFEDQGPSGKPPMEFGYVFNGVVTQVATHPEKCIVAAGYNNGTVLVGSIEYSNAWIARPPGSGAITNLL